MIREKYMQPSKKAPIRAIVDFSTEKRELRKWWNDIFKVQNGEENSLSGILYPVKMSFYKENEIKTFWDKHRGNLSPKDSL